MPIHSYRGFKTSLSSQLDPTRGTASSNGWIKILEQAGLSGVYEAAEFTAIVHYTPMGYSSAAPDGSSQVYMLHGRYARDNNTSSVDTSWTYLTCQQILGTSSNTAFDPDTHLKLTYNGLSGAEVWVKGSGSYTSINVLILSSDDGVDDGNYDASGWSIPDSSDWAASFTSMGNDVNGIWGNITAGNINGNVNGYSRYTLGATWHDYFLSNDTDNPTIVLAPPATGYSYTDTYTDPTVGAQDSDRFYFIAPCRMRLRGVKVRLTVDLGSPSFVITVKKGGDNDGGISGTLTTHATTDSITVTWGDIGYPYGTSGDTGTITYGSGINAYIEEGEAITIEQTWSSLTSNTDTWVKVACIWEYDWNSQL